MKLEDQVCNLELAKKLKELGVKQESAFYWCDGYLQSEKHFGGISGQEVDYPGCGCCGGSDRIEEKISAFTVAELGQLLPENFASVQNCCFYSGRNLKWANVALIVAKTEADARAKMLIHLLGRRGDESI